MTTGASTGWRYGRSGDLRRISLFHKGFGEFIRLVIHRFGRLRVSGLENIPQGGGIIVSNHVGWLDPIWIAEAVWPRPVFFMAKKELFTPLLGRLLTMLGAFPVDRHAPGPSALKIPAEVIRKNGLVVIFPGGTRTSQSVAAKRGAATIAVLTGCPIVPAVFSGPAKLELKQMLHRPGVTVDFSRPLTAADADGANGSAKAAIQRLAAAIQAQLEEAG